MMVIHDSFIEIPRTCRWSPPAVYTFASHSFAKLKHLLLTLVTLAYTFKMATDVALETTMVCYHHQTCFAFTHPRPPRAP